MFWSAKCHDHRLQRRTRRHRKNSFKGSQRLARLTSAFSQCIYIARSLDSPFRHKHPDVTGYSRMPGVPETCQQQYIPVPVCCSYWLASFLSCEACSLQSCKAAVSMRLTSSRSCACQGELAAQNVVLCCATLQLWCTRVATYYTQFYRDHIACKGHKLFSPALHCLSWSFACSC